jgi:hypothetical protein
MSTLSRNFSSLPEADQQLLMAYLYNTLSENNRLKFEKRLDTESTLAEALTAEQEFERFLPRGLKPDIDSTRAQVNQFALHKALRQSKQPAFNIKVLLASIWPTQGSRSFQLASMAVTFLLGIWFAQSNDFNQMIHGVQQDSVEPALAFVPPDDFEITDVQLGDINSENGDIQLTYSWSSKKAVAGNLADDNIQHLLVASIKNNANDGTRLNLVNILQPFAESQTVQEALVFSLLNDPNPGVRLMAAESLVNYSEQKSTRSALLETLKEESNPGIRIQVYQALLNHLDDPETVKTIQQFSVQDSNQYIRDHAIELVKTMAETSVTKI